MRRSRSRLGALLRLSVVAAVAGAVVNVLARRSPLRAVSGGDHRPEPGTPAWPAFAPSSGPTGPTRATMSAGTLWEAPCDGGCPESHPIKAKTASGIYHRPGGRSYDRTTADRCYRLEAEAEADGFRAARA